MPQDQKHPQENRDRETVNRLLRGEPTDFHLAELARLRTRYLNFPGARDIQRDLNLVLQQWQLSEAQLFEKTRYLHQTLKVYQRKRSEDQQDWS